MNRLPARDRIEGNNKIFVFKTNVENHGVLLRAIIYYDETKDECTRHCHDAVFALAEEMQIQAAKGKAAVIDMETKYIDEQGVAVRLLNLIETRRSKVHSQLQNHPH